MTLSIQELLTVARRDPAALDQALEQRRADVTPQFAADARKLWKEAISAGRLDDAVDAALVSRSAYVVVDMPREAVAMNVDLVQTFFMAAQTADDYSSTRDMALATVETADGVEAADLGFRAAALAADCSYWAADALGTGEREDWLLTALDDVIAASRRADATSDPASFSIFVSLLAAIAERCMETVWMAARQEREAQAGLGELATAADSLVPADFEFQGPGNRTGRIASVLARLSADYAR